jgi:putative membrane protein
MDTPRTSAEQRTDYAEDRTVLASERTFAGWLRTGYAAVGIALAFNALFGRLQPLWVAKAIATAFLLIAVAIFLAAENREMLIRERLSTNRVKAAKRWWIRLISLASVACSLALAAAIWLLPMRPA